MLIGILPNRLLLFNEIYVSDDREPRLLGMLSVSEFESKFSTLRLVSEPEVDTHKTSRLDTKR